MNIIVQNSAGLGIIGAINNHDHPHDKIIMINNGKSTGDTIGYVDIQNKNIVSMKTFDNISILCSVWLTIELCRKLCQKYNKEYNFPYGGILLFSMNKSYERQVWLYDTDMINGFLLDIPCVNEYNFGNFVIGDILYIRNTNQKYTNELNTINIITSQTATISDVEIRGSYNGKLLQSIGTSPDRHIFVDHNLNKIETLNVESRCDIIGFDDSILLYNSTSDQYIITGAISSKYKYIGGEVSVAGEQEFIVADKYLIITEFYLDINGFNSSLQMVEIFIQ
jgi:hypothetical protein